MSHEIIQLKVEDKDNFIYIIADRHQGVAAVVDPAWDAEGIKDALEEEGLTLEAILLTHSHFDHVNAVKKLANKNVSVFISELEYPHWQEALADAILLQDGDEILLGSASITMISTPGHTMGSCCYRAGNSLVTGDTLFIFGAGNCKDGDASALFASLQKIKKLPKELIIYAGHDYGNKEFTSLDEQLQGNPFLLIDNESDFIRYRQELAQKFRRVPYQALSKDELQQQML